MRISRSTKLLVAVLISAFMIWRAIPYYMFFAFADGSTLPATTWLVLPENPPQAQRVGNELYRDTGASLMNAMDRHRVGIGAAAISSAVLIGDEVVWAGTSGWADIGTRIAASPDTRFRIGSTSKALTATGLARSIEENLISLDTPLQDLWDEIPNPAWGEMTPRQLASHMSGLPHYGENSDFSGLMHTLKLQEHYSSVHDSLVLFDDSDLLFTPGSDFFYSTYGTVLLSAALSKAAGKSYLDLMNDLVFEPSGMDAVVVSPKSSEDLPNLATPYHSNGEQETELRVRRWRDVDLSHRLAGGGFAATSSDLVRLGKNYFPNSNPTALPTEIIEQMFVPQRLDSGEINEQNYAIGWRIREEEFLEGVEFMHANHGGVSRGGQSWLMLIPEKEMAVALNINGRTDVFWDFGSFSYEIATAFIERIEELEK